MKSLSCYCVGGLILSQQNHNSMGLLDLTSDTLVLQVRFEPIPIPSEVWAKSNFKCRWNCQKVMQAKKVPRNLTTHTYTHFLLVWTLENVFTRLSGNHGENTFARHSCEQQATYSASVQPKPSHQKILLGAQLTST